jgi:hypothetical protein
MLVILIHTNEAERLRHARPALARVTSLFPESRYLEVFEQPAIVPVPAATAIRRRLAQYVVARQWARYNGAPVRGGVRFAADALKSGVNAVKGAANGRLRRRFALETILANKHIESWRRLIDSDQRFAILAESDAVIADDAYAGIAALGAVLPADDRFFYADLAGGVDPATLGLAEMTVERIGPYAHLSRCATNTTCCYAISRSMAAAFLNIHNRRPPFFDFTPDWLINAMFLTVTREGGSIECWHAVPPVITHGSASGIVSSTLR